MRAAWVAIEHGNASSITDGAVGAQMGYAAVHGALWNVLINLKDISDPAFVREMRGQSEALLREAKQLLDQVTAHVDKLLVELSEAKMK
jgi:glutamate formiminotransferase/formiminotetrahydrofolate cyclodeaminase